MEIVTVCLKDTLLLFILVPLKEALVQSESFSLLVFEHFIEVLALLRKADIT